MTGRSDIDFIGRSRLWLYISIALVAVSVGALVLRGLNYSIEFTGGSSFTVTGTSEEFTVDELTSAVTDEGPSDVLVQLVDDGAGARVDTEAIAEIDGVTDSAVIAAISDVTGGDVSVSSIGPRWGRSVTKQAVTGLVVFLILVAIYIALFFEWQMAIAAIVTLIHDVVVTVGIYALVGFNVSPSTVIALLTILGYSLYDTVVVFDRIREDVGQRKISGSVYAETANEALNQMLVRSLSTSVTSILPVASLLFIGTTLLGATTISDLALALFIGMAIGTYSSIFVATPILVWLKGGFARSSS